VKQIDHDSLQIDITMEDQKALDMPWKTALYYQLKSDWNIMEHVCPDNTAFLGFEKLSE
jgi:hypothetical protein